ncbi:hypothetical protein SS50377_25208 [Spironucleus salmonicida]|uniref:Uncharacterized protein n=1 Tax=Spironucleus salmonicida TaxID=348837 RepID=A0A9P8LRW4_9EUKA|nr:hypothetical protein SS50377_25208 [Spironucleus salmonicida]
MVTLVWKQIQLSQIVLRIFFDVQLQGIEPVAAILSGNSLLQSASTDKMYTTRVVSVRLTGVRILEMIQIWSMKVWQKQDMPREPAQCRRYIQYILSIMRSHIHMELSWLYSSSIKFCINTTSFVVK